MKTINRTDSVPAALWIVASLNAAFLFGNGLAMLFTPFMWYNVVPGVSHTGPFNPHFVMDIGLIQMFLGAMLGLGLARPAGRFLLWAAAATWLSAHALLHFWEVAAGICPPSALARDFAAVTLPALIGITLSWWSWRAGDRPTNSIRYA
ncbi:hypothetical protein [Haloferula sp. BvORR071]|uniref:hypothetical protein n=1 Tax=Haloferula sp. BvORR071 TaxID=1396141 RepID=UPI000697AB6F|nr:hypothetical protein [Haloferula sp. BvORR071]